jgi:hypothetical protein
LSYDLLIDRGGDGSTPLGTIEELRRAIEAVFPATRWSAPGLGGLDEGAGSIEFSIIDGAPITSFGILLHGEFIGFLERVDHLAATNGWSVFDPQDPQGGDDA